ncbi:MAG: two-component regulator propeller domain-containing protein [Ignavibacteria bacterium]
MESIKLPALLLLILALFSTTNLAYGQNQWKYYHPNNSGLPGNIVPDIIIDSTNAKWFATNNGLARLKGNTWTVWDTTNSLIPNNFIQSIIKDKENNIWIATRNKGIVKYDGINWTLYYNTNLGYPLLAINRLRVDNNNTLWACSQTLGLLKYLSSINKWVRYYTANSGLPDNSVTDVQFENNIKWIGTVQGGIARFNDTSWTIYNHNNTPLESDFIERVGIDNFDNKWFCTRFGGVAKFNSDQNQWTIYTSTNSGLPWNNTYSIFFDEQNTKWIGIAGGGFTIFNDTNWVTALDTNSTTVGDFKKDKYNNVWICASEGVWVYNPQGIVKVYENSTVLPKSIALYQNFPNPFNPFTKIKYSVKKEGYVTLSIYDITGRKINTIVNNRKSIGEYEIVFNGAGLSSGIYLYTLESDDIKITKSMILLK